MNSLYKEENEYIKDKVIPCPFCGSTDDIEFQWTAYMGHCRINCASLKNSCFVSGPQIYYKKYDNPKRMINRCIKAWNKRGK